MRMPHHNPLSFFLSCALSTAPDSDTSGNYSESNGRTKLVKSGRTEIDKDHIALPVISNQSVSFPAEFSSSASSASTKSSEILRLKPMERDERLAYLEDTIKGKDTALMSLSNKADALADERRAILKLPESSRDRLLLKSIEDDLSDMKNPEKQRLVAEIAKHEAEINELKQTTEELVGAPVPAIGNYIIY
jgi:hypothetical protein